MTYIFEVKRKNRSELSGFVDEEVKVIRYQETSKMKGDRYFVVDVCAEISSGTRFEIDHIWLLDPELDLLELTKTAQIIYYRRSDGTQAYGLKPCIPKAYEPVDTSKYHKHSMKI